MDGTDRDIVLALLSADKTVHELSKALYKTEDQWELRKRNSFLRYRLERLEHDGFVRRREDGKTFYVPREDMTIGNAKVVVENGAGSIEVPMGRALVTTKKDGAPQILLLE